MISLSYKIKLLSDATPGSGLGSSWINTLVTRGFDGRPQIRPEHVKGLLRDRLEEIAVLAQLPDGLVDKVLGIENARGRDGEAAICLSPLPLHDTQGNENGASPVRLISRTALNRHGTVVRASLRTVEALAAGSEFKGTIRLMTQPASPVDLAVRMALLSIGAVGSSRTRGSGACVIHIEGESRGPGALLKALLTSGEAPQAVVSSSPVVTTKSAAVPAPGPARWFRMVFTAQSEICCPATPVMGEEQGNVITSDFLIPASAVQGAILTRLNAVDPQTATSCFKDDMFRAWPLLPMSDANQVSQAAATWPVLVPLSHRMSKLPNDHDEFEFLDSAVDVAPHDWRNTAKGSPLKGTRGVLLRRDDEVKLWREGEIPRVISAHVKVNDRKGQSSLFTVEALAPMTFGGLIALPSQAAELLCQLMEKDPWLVVGKARSVRGGGRLQLLPIQPEEVFAQWPLHSNRSNRVFVLQSPAMIPNDLDIAGMSADEILAELIERAGLGAVEKGQPGFAATQATTGLRFGWERNQDGGNQKGRLQAVRVVEPGAVFTLMTPVSDIQEVMLRGLGQGRERGYGCLIPHPGKAQRPFVRDRQIPNLTGSQSGKIGVELHQLAGDHGPSPSQISALLEKFANPKKALEYLQKQIQERNHHIAQVWLGVFPKLKTYLEGDDPDVVKGLEVWRNLTIIHRKQEDQP